MGISNDLSSMINFKGVWRLLCPLQGYRCILSLQVGQEIMLNEDENTRGNWQIRKQAPISDTASKEMKRWIQFICVFRSGCFSSIYFNGCMETLMVDEETQLKAARYIRWGQNVDFSKKKWYLTASKILVYYFYLFHLISERSWNLFKSQKESGRKVIC